VPIQERTPEPASDRLRASNRAGLSRNRTRSRTVPVTRPTRTAFQSTPISRVWSCRLGPHKLHTYTVTRGALATACLAVVLSPSTSLAEETQVAAPVPAEAVQQVHVNSGFDALADQRSSTTARQVLTQEDIGRFADTNVADVLRRVPGVVVVSKQGKADVRMRGLGNGYTQILINGDPAPPGFSVDSLSPAVVERIEVLRTATADISAQAIAGTINIILRQPTRTSTRSVKASVGGPKGEESYSLSGQMSGVADKLSYSLSPAATETNSRTPTEIEQWATDSGGDELLRRRDDQGNSLRVRKAEIASTLKWKFDDRTSVTIEPWISARQIDDRTSDIRIATLGDAPIYARDRQDSRIEATLARLRVAWRQQVFDDADLDIKFGANRNRVLGTSQFDGFSPNGARIMDENIHATTQYGSYTAAGKFRAPVFDGHAVELGWDGALTHLTEDRRQRQLAPPGYPATDLDERNDVRIQRLALFAQDDWTISKQLSLYAGIRWESLSTDASGNLIDTTNNEASVFSPIVQILWRVPETKNDQIRLGLSRTYKAPTPEQLNPRRHVANDNAPTTPDTSGNPGLRPELAWGLDLAYEHYIPAAEGVLSASTYVRSIHDVTVQELKLDNGSWTSRPVNSGRAVVAGLALEAKMNLQKLDPDLPKIDVRGNTAWNWSRVDSLPHPGNRLASQTPFSAGLGFDYYPTTLPVTFGSSLNFTGGRSARISTGKIETLHDSMGWEAYALWKISDETKLRFTVANILARPSITDQAVTDSSGSYYQSMQEKRATTVRATLEMKL
jgi:outer membrane receptor for ferrienterochelin and colicins